MTLSGDSLQRIAGVVARGPADHILAIVNEEIALTAGADVCWLLHLESDELTVLARRGPIPHVLPVGERIPIDDALADVVARHRGTAAWPSPTSGDGPLAAAARALGIATFVATGIVVDGRTWGVSLAGRREQTATWSSTPADVANFIGLAAGTIAYAASQLAHVETTAAMHRVDGLLAADPDDAIQAVVVDASRLPGGDSASLLEYQHRSPSMLVVATHGLDVSPGSTFEAEDLSIAARILRTRRPARIDDYAVMGPDAPSIARTFDFGAAVGMPVVLAGQLWGVLTVISASRPLPPDTEGRLSALADRAGAAVSRALALAEVHGLAAGQRALLGVAKMVAQGATDDELFEEVAREASRLLGDEATTLVRMDGARTFTIIATCGGPAAVGTRVVVPDDDHGTIATMLSTGRPARLDDYGSQSGPLYSRRDYGVGSSVSVPIIVDNRIWGALGTLTSGRRLPAGTEDRLQQFAEVVAAALANSQARADLQRLADEQGALRRVAELVARGVPPEEVFSAVTAQVSASLDGGATALARFDADGYCEVVAGTNAPTPIGFRFLPEPDSGAGYVLRTGRPFRRASYAGSALEDLANHYNVGAAIHVPIVVESRVWGMLAYSTAGEPLPEGIEDTILKYATLTAAAVANVEYRVKLTASRARVVATADETRRRLQRDVHDGVQQWLVQAVLALRLGGEAARRDESTAEFIDEALRAAERAVSELRDLVRGILPASLARGGLRAGLESLIAGLPLPVELEVFVPMLAPETEVSAYFVVAEALTNVVKHAAASCAVVTVTSTDDAVRIEIGDDGVGAADESRGSGLTGLLDRVEAANGTLTISSPPGVGTTLVATFPLLTAHRQAG